MLSKVNDDLPALFLLWVAMMMFGAFDYYQVPWVFQAMGVGLICGVPFTIMVVSSYLEKRKK